MTYKVGDRVVYPHHGAAVIEKKEKREAFGEKKEYLVLRMAHGELTLRVPTDNAEAVGMRPPIAKDDVEDLYQVLAKRDVREPSNWSRRFKNHQEKLKSGDVYQVAEVVRNLALREADRGLSAGEKSMLAKARGVLVSELSFALDVPEDEALERVAEYLVTEDEDED
jgi:CarD family transcriptional regulator